MLRVNRACNMVCKKMVKDEILLTDKSFFKDDNEHPYEGMFYNGIAYLTRVECDENNGCPEKLLLGYPQGADITARQADAIREWCGLGDDDDITNFNIALKYGKIGRSGLNADELNLLDSIARKNKMDWFITTPEGNFKDGETGKKISPKKAVKQLIEGTDERTLEGGDKEMLIRILTKLL